MKSEKGVTLTSLVIYVLVFFIIISIIDIISSSFKKNIENIIDPPKYVAEFNSFSMFFVLDVKQNSDVKSVNPTSLEFEDGTAYTIKNGSIYRNNFKIAKDVKNFTFTSSDYTENDFTKKIINVKAEFGNNKESITRDIDFVLKYW